MAIVNLALEEPNLSPRELAVDFSDTNGSFASEASVYRLLKDHGLITLQAGLVSGLDQVKVLHRPRLLSDNGPSYLSSELDEWL